jgi:hypothetical protein
MRVSGTLRVPGDKSISHRSLIFAALADGESRVRGILESADVHSTADVLRTLGADIPALSEDFVVRGRGLRSFEQPARDLDCGNSGTTTRLMAGVVAALPISLGHLGTTQAAWLWFFASQPPARLLAFSLAAHLSFSVVRGGLGLVFMPAVYRHLSASLNWDTAASANGVACR